MDDQLTMSDDEVLNNDIDDGNEEEDELLDWQLPLCFMKKRHKDRIEGLSGEQNKWKLKEKVYN